MPTTQQARAIKLAKFYANSPQWEIVSLDKLSPQGVADSKRSSSRKK